MLLTGEGGSFKIREEDKNRFRCRISTNVITTVTNKDGHSYKQDDLVYRDYDTGIKLSSNSKLIISQIDLNLENETAIIYAINLENSEAIKLYDYHPNQVISYVPDSDGIYIIVAELSDGEIIDLTPKAIETTNLEEDSGGYILLQ